MYALNSRVQPTNDTFIQLKIQFQIKWEINAFFHPGDIDSKVKNDISYPWTCVTLDVSNNWNSMKIWLAFLLGDKNYGTSYVSVLIIRYFEDILPIFMKNFNWHFESIVINYFASFKRFSSSQNRS